MESKELQKIQKEITKMEEELKSFVIFICNEHKLQLCQLSTQHYVLTSKNIYLSLQLNSYGLEQTMYFLMYNGNKKIVDSICPFENKEKMLKIIMGK